MITRIYLRYGDDNDAAGTVVANRNATAEDVAASPRITNLRPDEDEVQGSPTSPLSMRRYMWHALLVCVVLASGIVMASLIPSGFEADLVGSPPTPSGSDVATSTISDRTARLESKLGSGADYPTVLESTSSVPSEATPGAADWAAGDTIDLGDKLARADQIAEAWLPLPEPASLAADPDADAAMKLQPSLARLLTGEALAVSSVRQRTEIETTAVSQLPVEAFPSDVVTRTPSDVSVNRLTVTSGIRDREPIDAVDRLAVSDGEVFAHASIQNNGPKTQIIFLWYQGDRLVETTPLDVGQADAWRTWSRRDIEAGTWRVQVRDETGGVLAESNFVVE